MRYLLLLTSDPDTAEPSIDDRADVIDDWVTTTETLRDAGVLVAGDGLHPADTATTLRLRRGERLVTDGPYAETKELLIGYYLLDVANFDAALDWAARMPNVVQGAVEIRPVMTGPASASPAASDPATPAT